MGFKLPNSDITQAVANAWRDACASTSPSRVIIPRGTYKLKEASFKGPCKAPIEIQVQGTLQAPQDGGQLSKPDTWIGFHTLTGSRYRVVEPLMAKEHLLGNKMIATKTKIANLLPLI
ncbi:hypothetical protein M0R45_032772 [Rubus argutus]|uniref:Polygalacturonase n=1 Tax=Rubus argutus TaxID=59490 RepID=A0AAW1WL92_RUBAR